jgi:DNA mismatch endonuclease (patch repair protein)
MPDVFTKSKRAAVMARIRSRGNRDTELALARLLRRARLAGWRRHFQIRISESGVRIFRVRPDFVFPGQRVAVFVDGCFWHGCPLHSPPARWLRKSSMPAVPRSKTQRALALRTGKRFWRQKLAANIARDRHVTLRLRRAGWRVIRIWEHALAGNPARCVQRIRQALEARNEG